MAAKTILQSGAKAQIEADNEKKAYLLSRQRADDLGKILNPHEVSDDYDFTRLMYTTLGNAGKGRAITQEDMAQFRANARSLGSKYKGGITITQAIDGSLLSDIERANKQIATAIPVRYRSGLIHFQTNASVKSDLSRHHVHVQLMEYPSAVASPASAKSVAAKLKNAKVSLDCDCGRWRYWYRYMATIGKYTITPESGYPKIRNPDLHGLCCKHILRVLQVMRSPVFQPRLVQMIEDSRAKVGEKTKNITLKDQRRLQKSMDEQRKKEGARIFTSDEKKLMAQVRKINAAAKPANAKRAAKAAKKTVKATATQTSLAIARASLEKSGLPESVIQTMLAAAEKEMKKAAKA